MSLFLDIVIAMLVGLLVIAVLVAATFVMTLCLDRFCSSDFTSGNRIFSPVSRRAHLWGLTLAERRAILDQILVAQLAQQTTNTSKKESVVEIEMTDLSSSTNLPLTRPDGSETLPESTTSAASSVTGEAQRDLEDGAAHVEEEDEDAAQTQAEVDVDVDAAACDCDNDEDLEQNCAICLKEYEPKDNVVSGALCNHKFHRTCILEWMEIGHDDCPYCRKAMMTPMQMRQVAIQVLGTKRVKILSRGATADVPLSNTNTNTAYVNPSTTTTSIQPGNAISSGAPNAAAQVCSMATTTLELEANTSEFSV